MNTLKKLAATFAAAAVASVSLASVTFSASADVPSTSEPPYQAWLSFQAGGLAQWEPGEMDGESATFNGNGTYEATVVVPEDNGSETLELLILSTNINGYAFVEEGKDMLTEGTAKITVDSVKILHVDGSEEALPYSGPSEGAFSTENNGTSLRMNIFNEWGNSVRDIPNKPDNGFPGLISGDTLKVTFTVDGINAGGGSDEASGNGGNGGGNNDDNNGNGGNGGANNSTTAAGDNGGATTTTTAAAGGNNGGNSNSNSNSNSSSNKNNSGSNNSTSGNNATTSQTGDFGIAAVVLGAVATAALGAGAFTVTRRKK